MKIKNFIAIIIFYLSIILFSSIVYIASFWTDIFISDNNFNRALKLLLVITLLITICLNIFLISKKNIHLGLISRDIYLIALLFFMLNWIVYGLIPFNVSRSNSIIIIGYLNKADSPKSKSDIQDFVFKKYFLDYDAISYRLNEQINSGNITLSSEGYLITNRGIVVSKVINSIANLYNIDNNFLDLEKD